jgi:hypothetical protein
MVSGRSCALPVPAADTISILYQQILQKRKNTIKISLPLSSRIVYYFLIIYFRVVHNILFTRHYGLGCTILHNIEQEISLFIFLNIDVLVFSEVLSIKLVSRYVIVKDRIEE